MRSVYTVEEGIFALNLQGEQKEESRTGEEVCDQLSFRQRVSQPRQRGLGSPGPISDDAGGVPQPPPLKHKRCCNTADGRSAKPISKLNKKCEEVDLEWEPLARTLFALFVSLFCLSRSKSELRNNTATRLLRLWVFVKRPP